MPSLCMQALLGASCAYSGSEIANQSHGASCPAELLLVVAAAQA